MHTALQAAICSGVHAVEEGEEVDARLADTALPLAGVQAVTLHFAASADLQACASACTAVPTSKTTRISKFFMSVI